MLLGGSASPIQEDLCVVCASARNKIRVLPDSSKGNAFTRIISHQFYDKSIKLSATLEADIIFEQLTLFFTRKKFERHFSNTTNITDQKTRVLICPGASVNERRWTAKTLTEIVNHIASLDIAVTISVLGTKIDGITYKDLRSFFMANKINIQFNNFELSELEAIIVSSEIVVTNDSAPMHIARMYRRPMVVISGQGHINRFIGESNFG